MSQTSAVKRGAGKELTAEDIELLKIRSKLDEEEIKRLHAEFWRDNPTGTMDKTAYEQFHSQLNADSAIRKLKGKLAFLLFDTDRNEGIDFVEFLMAKGFESAKTPTDALGYLFDMCDKNDDGRMGVDELMIFGTVAGVAAAESQQPGAWEMIKLAGKILGMFGSRGKDKLTKEEFIKKCEKNLLLCKTFECAN